MILPTTTNFYNHLIDFHNKVSTFPLEDIALSYDNSDDATSTNTNIRSTRLSISLSIPDDTPPKEVWTHERNKLNTIIGFISHNYVDVNIKVAAWRDSPRVHNEVAHFSVLPPGVDEDAYEACQPYLQGDWSPWMQLGQKKYLRVNLFHSAIATHENMALIAQRCRDGLSNQWVSVCASHALDPVSLSFFSDPLKPWEPQTVGQQPSAYHFQISALSDLNRKQLTPGVKYPAKMK
jgi:hypothetical protein